MKTAARWRTFAIRQTQPAKTKKSRADKQSSWIDAAMTRDASWPDQLKWAEENGLKNLQEKFTTADGINKEAPTTLTYVLAAMGATFGRGRVPRRQSNAIDTH